MLCGHVRLRMLGMLTGYQAAELVRFLRIFNWGSPPSPWVGQPLKSLPWGIGCAAFAGNPPPGLLTTTFPRLWMLLFPATGVDPPVTGCPFKPPEGTAVGFPLRELSLN